MPFDLPLPAPFQRQGWKVKIRDRERLEPPHVTILHRTRAWRLGLRDGEFLDRQPDPGLVPAEVIRAVLDSLDVLCREWDRRYPGNPVRSSETNDHE